MINDAYDKIYNHDKINHNELEEVNKKIYNDTILSGKIHESLEDPISQTLYDISDLISPTFYDLGITPNIVTTTRLLMTFIGFIYFFQNEYYSTSAILFFVSYFGDCLDGHMARKYNLESNFGDYYDHLADAMYMFLSLYYISVNIHPEFDWLVIVLFILGIMSLVQIGCEERYLKLMKIGKHSETLDGLSCLCPKSLIDDSELDDLMEFSRLIGIGTFILIVTIIIWNFRYFKNGGV